ncbi:MAG: hypothetical protein CME34_17845 [Gordonia sp.]|nr:hypothetical protein [Gordonia sp. (in: high G+C Gram-positive bacteria)]
MYEQYPERVLDDLLCDEFVWAFLIHRGLILSWGPCLRHVEYAAGLAPRYRCQPRVRETAKPIAVA